MKFSRFFAIFAALAMLAGACGGSDSADDAGSDDAGTSDTDSGDSDSGDSGGGELFDVDAVVNADLDNCVEAPTGDPVKVGFAADFSEVTGFVTEPATRFLPYVVELINCAGGLNGAPVELKIVEVGDDATLAATELLDDGAHFLLAPPFADFALPILQVTGGETPVFLPASTEPVLGDSSINSFLLTFDDIGMSTAAAEWALEEGFTRAILFTEGEGVPYTGVNPDAFAAAFTAGGGEIVSTQTYVWGGDTDFSAQVNEIAEVADGTEIVFSAALGFQVTALRGQLEGQGFDGMTYMGTDALDATGITFEDNSDGVLHTPHQFIESGDQLDTMLTGFHDSGGEELGSQAFMGLYADSLFLGFQGIINCGCTDPVGIGDAVKVISGFPGVSGEITYEGTNGIPDKAVPIVRVEGGVDTLVTLWNN